MIVFPPEAYTQVKQHNGMTKKGSIVEISRIAGILGAKQTGHLIPLCHTLNLEGCDIQFEFCDDLHHLLIYVTTSIHHKTGIEMEALTGASIAALTIYDMCKALSHEITFSIALVQKQGGKHNVTH